MVVLYNMRKKGTSKMQINDQLVNQMLRNLPQDQQRVMAGILRNEITHEVNCDGAEHKKKNNPIAHLTTDGQVIPLKDNDGVMWLRATRRRTDGEVGFECWCGQDTRIAPNELGVLKADGTQPSKEDLYRMAANLEKNPPKYATINGERPVDGFTIKEVRK